MRVDTRNLQSYPQKFNEETLMLDQWISSTLDDEKINVLYAKSILHAMLLPSNLRRFYEEKIKKGLYCYFEEQKYKVIAVDFDQYRSEKYLLVLENIKKDKTIKVCYLQIEDWKKR